jgi:hypothetical protein
MPCKVGDEIQTGSVQKTIREQIMNAAITIADISKDNINSLIEAGIVLGARKELKLVSSDPRHRAPFMLSDQQVHYYSNDVGWSPS